MSTIIFRPAPSSSFIQNYGVGAPSTVRVPVLAIKYSSIATSLPASLP